MDAFTLANLTTLKLNFEYLENGQTLSQQCELVFPLYEVLDTIKEKIEPIYERKGTRGELWEMLKNSFATVFPGQGLDKLTNRGIEQLWLKLLEMEKQLKKDDSANANPG